MDKCPSERHKDFLLANRVGDVMAMTRSGIHCGRRSERLRSTAQQSENPILQPSGTSSSNSSIQSGQQSSSSGSIISPAPRRRRLSRVDVVTDEVAAALDRCNISNRNAMHVLSAVAKAFAEQFQFSLADVNLSISTIRRKRKEHRTNYEQDILKTFPEPTLFTVHWDGKRLDDSTAEIDFR